MIYQIVWNLIMVPDLVAFSFNAGSIHLGKYSMRCDTKRAIWWDVFNKHISIVCIKDMSTIFGTLQINKWWSEKQTFFSFCEINATKFGSKNEISYTIINNYMTSYGYVIVDYSWFMYNLVSFGLYLLLLVTSLTAHWNLNLNSTQLNSKVFISINMHCWS